MTAALILVVEDNPTTRKMMRIALQADGYSVVEAEDGESALRLAVQQAPALILLDCKLPDMDGFEVGRRLLTVAPNIPVVAVTGWAQVDEGRVLTAGFWDMLVKPVEPSRLIEIVERYVGRAPPRSTHTGSTVLLVDDDPTQRKLAHLALTRAGFKVIATENGAAALRLAVSERPAVVVSDVLMPGMDGFSLCLALRSDPALSRLPIVLMSAHYLEAADRELAARFGATRYVSRTGGFDNVIRAVLDAMDSHVSDSVPPPGDDMQDEHLRRIAHQLERQARIGIGLARRASLQASALSVLDGLANSLARQLDPENALNETLAECVDAAGLSVGAILLCEEGGALVLKAHVGSKATLPWRAHSEVLLSSVSSGSLTVPSLEAGRPGEVLLAALGAASALIVPIVARDELLGVLLLASNGTDLATAEGESAARAARSVSTQLGQALALSRMFSKLVSAEQRYRALFENARDAIGVLNSDGVIIEANRAWEELAGAPREKLIGHNVAEFAPQAIAEGGGAVLPMALRRADGSSVQVELSRSVVELGGERHVLCIGRDVSERLRLEEQLRQSQKMDAMGRLAGGIAHDFNNVLSVIMSYGEILLDNVKAGDPMRDDIEEIRKAGKRASTLTRQLLMFSRQQVVEPKILDLNSLLTGIGQMLERIVGADVDFVSLPARSLGRVRVDPGSMEQVIMNLVVNARDAMPTGGKLTLETANVVFDEEYAREHHGVAAGRYVMLAVTDTGTGMDQATQARIFEPFYTTKAAGKGTGLGLSTVFGTAQQSGGSVWVYSELGKGTTFKVYLPRVDGALDSARPPSNVTPQCGTETVLLVEDDDQVRVVARDILRRSGYQVLEARNSGEALLQSEKHAGTIHLLLTDVVMPQLSGPELAKRLSSLRPDMRLLCMSGYTDDSIVRHGALAASIAYLEKPFTPNGLTAKVRDVLDATHDGPNRSKSSAD